MDAQTSDLQAVVRRLDKLEKQNRMFRIAAIVVAVLLGVAALLALMAALGRLNAYVHHNTLDAVWFNAGHPKVGAGAVLGVLYEGTEEREEGVPQLFLIDRGTRQATLEIAGGTPALTLADEIGRPRAILSVQADGSPSLTFLDEEGQVIWQAP